MEESERIKTFFRVREPAYNIIQWLNHNRDHTKDRESLKSLVDTLSKIASFKAWIKKHTVPVDCRVDENDPQLFDAFANYFVSFFRTSLDIKSEVYCSICDLKDYTIGSVKPDKKAKARVPDLLRLTLDWLNETYNLKLSATESIATDEKFPLRQDLLFVTYVRESSRRVEFVGAGPVVHALWNLLTKDHKMKLTYQ